MNLTDLLISVTYFVWCIYVKIHQSILLPIYNQWCCMGSAKICPDDDSLVLCHYQYTDGRLFTFVQQSSSQLSSTVICCVILTSQSGSEVDITDAFTQFAGPHLDFHGSELTVTELLSCIKVDTDQPIDSEDAHSSISLSVALEKDGHFTEYTFDKHDVVHLSPI